jgi:rod shape determining protein RodA
MRIGAGIGSRGTMEVCWTLVILYAVFVLFGIVNIYSATYNVEAPQWFDLGNYAGKQILYAGVGVVIIAVVMLLDVNSYEKLAWLLYILAVILLLGLPIFGHEVKGNKAWYKLGFFSLQPSEIAKVATALALSAYLARYKVSMKKISHLVIAAVIIALPMVLTGLQDTGSGMVFASFFIVLYMAGASGVYFMLCGAVVLTFITDVFIQHYELSHWWVFTVVGGLSVVVCAYRMIKKKKIWGTLAFAVVVLGLYSIIHFYVWEGVFKEYQRQRILTSLKLIEDNDGVGFNTYQSEIAIGSGGWIGKGFLEGSQTKGNFVPEQHTDFIFSTLGEEWGFMGTSLTVLSFAAFFCMIVWVAFRQRTYFARYYGLCVFGVFLFHFMINIAMTIGLMPVIGIPMPFFSYGGSSLWSFTVLLFILITLDAHRKDFLPEINTSSRR